METSVNIETDSQLELALSQFENDKNYDVLHSIAWYYDRTLHNENTATKYYELNIEHHGEDYKLSIYNLAHIFRWKDTERCIKLCETIMDEDRDALFMLGSVYQFEDPEKTLFYWNKCIEKGDGKTLCILAQCYTRTWKPFEHNPKKGFELYIKAATELDYKPAWMNISDCYREGIGVDANNALETDALLKVPPEMLDQTHKFNLAINIYKGYGITRDYDKSLKMFHELDETFNDPDAQYMIGDAYRYGKGVERNLAIAKEWFIKSANNKDILACHTLLQLLSTPVLSKTDDNIEDTVLYHKYFEKYLKLRQDKPWEIKRNKLEGKLTIEHQSLDKMYCELLRLRKEVEEYELKPPLLGGRLFREARDRMVKTGILSE